MENKRYICIDLKSFYASVECVERGLDPLSARLVVADEGRTEKTICLAVSPALKAYGIPGRPRLFEVVQRINFINEQGRKRNKNYKEITYITAPPRMSLYMEYSRKIYNIYLKYVAPEDVHIYSVDEVFIDVTGYLRPNKCTAHEFAMKLIRDVLRTTGITATAGIGTNMYLAKIAMDIVAKKAEPDNDGVRIAELDVMSYRKQLWSHTPITDFWRVGKGYAKKLEGYGLHTMGDIARCSIGKPHELYNEDLLYKLFGVNAELLIDHAWGIEPCTMEDIKSYKPENRSMGTGQVLHCPYDAEKTRLIIREMTDLLVLDLVSKGLVTDQIVMTIGYDIENLTDKKIRNIYRGAVTTDRYGRRVPKPAHGTINLDSYSSSTKNITEAAVKLYDKIVHKDLLVRRMNIAANHVIYEKDMPDTKNFEQMDLFTDYEEQDRKRREEDNELKKEKNIQRAILSIKKKFGNNAVVKGMNLEEGATSIERNCQIGGHKA